MNREFVLENAIERQRMNDLLLRLSDIELHQELSAGWSVADALAHLAFWDYRAIVLITRWKTSGFVQPSRTDVGAINDAILPLIKAIPPKEVVKLALSAAEEIDLALEKAPDELLRAIGRSEDTFNLSRADHRREHLDEIEALQAAQSK